ncbi:unnamed protein product [Dibothriocephalus latus]|uniref:Uncharacterized protein n=1 Tax=Dibothriocephalus latus TaxID=60516 RepID=A0A3P7P164_DIBLA|nr:unnamed protein product [Dibothriocephalus latus]
MVGEEETCFPSEKPSEEDMQGPSNDFRGHLDSTEDDDPTKMEPRLLDDESGEGDFSFKFDVGFSQWKT